ncbi:GNAT family N-acetyltransferase [Sphingobium sp. AP49]|uniref:GNAT family N-acetyltransferase n=1 Tax=Sphingobium sp. AP49 TaxID=1144307 RepID=UPI00026EE4F9|nr:GNAT family N-acetyltransferase [Sphingobium sp. AP49]WHO37613.1 GNAT family N-acetyltransferase [Sphingobium sp. AP49]
MLVPREYRTLTEVALALADRLDRAHVPNLFDRLDWHSLLHIFCFADTPLRVLHLTEDHCELWMFLLAPAPRRLSALANWYSFSWAPVFLGDPDIAAQGRMLEAIAHYLRAGHAQIDLYPVAMPDQIVAAFRRAGWFAVDRPMGGRHLLHLKGRDFATYWAERPGRLRNQVRRKARAGRFTLSITDQLTDGLWHDYVAVQSRSWKESEPGLPFLRAMAERESAAGTLRLGFARLDGQPVATQLWTVENGVALIHKLAHDQAYDEGSPGTLLSHAMFAHAIDVDHVGLIDYGTGDNDYKREWMEERETLHQVDLFNPRMASAWIPAARTAISALVG